jgi:hypothetical protein
MRSSITILFVLFNILLCFVWSVEKKRKNEDFSDFDDDEFVIGMNNNIYFERKCFVLSILETISVCC